MDDLVPRWVRIGLVVAIAPGQVLTGLWAVLAARNWFDHFPGVGADLVAAEPPYNAHLATDAGAGFLATGVALVAAAIWGQRAAVYVALLTYFAFALPHLGYHATHPSDALSGVEQATNLALLGSGVVMAAVLCWGARSRPAPGGPRRRTTRVAPTG
jgi:hypothetical protein